MSVQNITRRAGPYVGTGLVSAYTFAFKVFRSEDVKVVRSASSDANAQDETLTLGTDYTVKLNADQNEKAGGTVTLVSPLAEGLRLSILSAITPDQQMVLTNHDGMLPTTLNDSADKAIALIQELQELLGRGITVPATSAMSPAELLNELVSAAKDARLSAEEAKKFAQICEEIKQNIFIYSWDIPHVVDTLDDVEKYPFDGFFAVGGYGDPGHHGQDISNRVVKARGSTELRTLGEWAEYILKSKEKISTIISVRDFGAVGNGIADDTDAFDAASKVSNVVFVPKGTYKVTRTPKSKLFALTTAKVLCNGATFNLSNTPQELSVLEQSEIDGKIVRLSNFCLGIDAGTTMQNSSISYANMAIGTSAAERVGDDIRRVSAIGQYSCRDLKKGYSVTAIGTNAAEWTNVADRVTLVGDNSGKNLGSTDTSRHGYFIENGATPAEFDVLWPEWRTFAGEVGSPKEKMTPEMFEHKATHIVGVGRNAFGFSITASDSVGVGYDACTSLLYGSGCVGVGDRVMQWTIKADNSTFVGASAAQGLMDSLQDTAVGTQTVKGYVHSNKNTVMGYQAMAGLKARNTDNPSLNCFFGRISGANAVGSISNNSGFGSGTLANVTGNGNTAVGSNALLRLVTGDNNTAVGLNSLILMQDASNATAITNATGLGYSARVSGSNQVQLGNSETTVYAYGAVQDRSDARDKADVRDTILGSDFILSLRPVDFRWDMRDDYIETVEHEVTCVDEEGNESTQVEYEVIKHAKDGSKKRNRFHHGFIAQEIKETMTKLGVDFGGYQDHKVNGGSDVLSLGYEELIAPMVKTIQEMDMRIKALEAKEDK